MHRGIGMKKLILIALAGGLAAVPAGAIAQAGPAGAGVSVRHGGNATMRHGGNAMMRHGGGRFRHPGPNFRHHRLQRGFVMHPFWSGPQFHVQNWQLYGFSAPPRDHRWVRYYDDAYLVDRGGRVQDTRHGLDWDEYGERWEMDEGIPAYYGRGEWRPDERDYAWVEHNRPGTAEGWDYGAYEHGDGHAEDRRHEHEGGYEREGRYEHRGGHAYGEVHAPAYGPGYPPSACHPAPPQPCGGHGYGYGYGAGYGYYGYGVAYPIIIETTVYGGGATTYVEEVTEEVIEVQQRQRRHYRPRPRARPRPRPPAGERG